MTVGDFIKTIAKEKGTSAAKIERDLGFSNGYIGNLATVLSRMSVSLKLQNTSTSLLSIYGAAANPLQIHFPALFYPMMNPLCLSLFVSSINMTVARRSV